MYESAEPKGGKKLSILLLSTLCINFALRETPDLITKQTRTTSVICSPTKDLPETTKNKNNHHNPVFLNTNKRDPYSYASPEGHGTTPSEKCQRWSTVRPLGADMRLTALRQPSKNISRPKQSRQKKMKSITNNIYYTLLCDCKPISLESGKCGKAGLRATQPGGAVRATHST